MYHIYFIFISKLMRDIVFSQALIYLNLTETLWKSNTLLWVWHSPIVMIWNKPKYIWVNVIITNVIMWHSLTIVALQITKCKSNINYLELQRSTYALKTFSLRGNSKWQNYIALVMNAWRILGSQATKSFSYIKIVSQ